DAPEAEALKLSAAPSHDFIVTEAHKVVKSINSMECIRLAGVGRRRLAASLGASLGRCLAASSDVPAWPAACTGKRQSLWPLRFAIPGGRCKNRVWVKSLFGGHRPPLQRQIGPLPGIVFVAHFPGRPRV